MENAFPVYVEAWLSKIPDRVAFTLGGNTSVDYLVPFDLFYRGGMMKDGVLLADRARYLKRDKVSHGIQLYKIVEKEINGINLEDAIQIEQL